MAGMLSLKWNNHSHAFLSLLNNLLAKEQYCDATLACHGKFYPIHRMVLSTCSEYFQEIFRLTQCKHPFIIVNDIKPTDLEALLNYMYKGDVNVLQENLPSLIKAAEALKVKGLAVPDELPSEREDGTSKKRSCTSLNSYSHPKRSKTSERKGRHSSENGASLQSSVSTVSENDKISYDNLTSSSTIRGDSPVEVIEPEPPCADLEPGLPSSEPHPSVVKEEPYDDSYTSPIPKSEVVEAFSFSETIRDDWSTNLNGSAQTDHSSVIKTPLALPVGAPVVGLNPAGGDTDDSPPVDPPDDDTLPLFKCSLCSFYTSDLKKRELHIFTQHSQDLPFACDFCPYRCHSRTALLIHTRKHTGERPYLCSFDNCNYRSSSKCNLKRHMKGIHNSVV